MVIAEVGQAHDGSLGLAHAFIDAIAKAGAHAVKFQTHIARAESTLGEPWRIKFSKQDASRYEYWRRMEFDEEQWRGLRAHVGESGLKFVSSPFSLAAAELLSRIGLDIWKVASGELSNGPLLKFMGATGLPVLLSTGMSPMSEIDEAVRLLKTYRTPVTVLQCTSVYPCPPNKVGLNVIPAFRERYGCAVGLSDHSGAIYAGLAAATIGIDALEVHVTLSRDMPGPDVPASLTPSELRQLVVGIDLVEQMTSNPVDKDALAEELHSVRRLFTKSVVAVVDLPVGTILSHEHLTGKKPGTGIPVEKTGDLVGRRLRRAVSADTLLSDEDLDS
ncbi:MAG: N-acetylneuraminate synthase family protein [Nitrospiraceae bacterium]